MGVINDYVKFYNNDRGFGFIEGSDGYDYFMHISNVKSESKPKKGDIVTFKKSNNSKGLNATNINIIKSKTNKQKVITLDNIRVRVNNIRSYGIGCKNETEYVKKS